MIFIIANLDAWQNLIWIWSSGGNRNESKCKKDNALMMHEQLYDFLPENHAGNKLFCII